MSDPYANSDDAAAPIRRAQAIVLSSDTPFPTTGPRALYVGGAGDIVVSFRSAPTNFLTFTNVSAGSILPFRIHTIRASSGGTTATNIVALF